MNGKSAPMRPRLKEYMAGERLILPAIYPVPNSFRCSTWHIRAKERIVDIHIEVKRKRSVFGHNILFVVESGIEPGMQPFQDLRANSHYAFPPFYGKNLQLPLFCAISIHNLQTAPL